MTRRENFISLVKRKGYEKVPIDFRLCPSLSKKFDDEKSYSFVNGVLNTVFGDLINNAHSLNNVAECRVFAVKRFDRVRVADKELA